MPTSIAHIGGRARYSEPGRYKKENNKNLMRQGLPNLIGKSKVLRRYIQSRVTFKTALGM
jgi:hypothetical protein